MVVSNSSTRTLMRHRTRVEQIVRVTSRYGYASWVASSVPDALREAASSLADPTLVALPDAERVRLLCTDLGTTFIKIGQVLSTRADLVGSDIAAALESLQSDVPADPAPVVETTVRDELGAGPDELFAAFDAEPLGSGSIAQVHAARLPDGSDVVVKVQHAGIGELIEADLDILEALAVLLESRDPQLAVYRPVAVVQQLRRSLLAELNFGLEAANLAAFRTNFAEEPDVAIPEPFIELSSRRVLTMSRLHGPPLTEEISRLGERAEPFVHRGADIYIEMIFRDGLFHADPHPGNIVVVDGDRVGLLDFGKVGRIDTDTQDGIDDLVAAALSEDLDGVIDGILRLCDPPATLDQAALRADMLGFVEQYVRVGAANLDLGGLNEAASTIMRRHRLFLPPDVALLLRTLTQLQGLLVQTGVDLKVVDVLAPYASMIAAKRFAPRRMMREARRTARDWERLGQTLPADVTAILQAVRAGQLDIPLRLEHLDRNVNRLVYAIIAAALFTGSSRLWGAGVPPVIGTVSVPGAVGTLSAGYFAAKLLQAAKRAGGIG